MTDEITWHYKGRLIWVGTTPLDWDVERDVKTGRIKRIYTALTNCGLVWRVTATSFRGDGLPVGTRTTTCPPCPLLALGDSAQPYSWRRALETA